MTSDRYFKSMVSFLVIILVIPIALMISSGSLEAGIYADFEIQQVSDDHLVIDYSPQFSDDLQLLENADLINLEGKRVWGRVLLLAIPPEGEFDFNYSFEPGGAMAMPKENQFITDDKPLVIHGSTFWARGHKIARLYIFPQRLEDSGLRAYSNFAIDIRFSGEKGTSRAEAITRLDSVVAEAVINTDQFYRFGSVSRIRPALKASSSGMFDPAAEWLKIGVMESGVARITGVVLSQAGIILSNLPSSTIRLFYAGGVNPPEDPAYPDPQLYQLPIRVEDGGDGYLEVDDIIYFYAEAPSRYEYDGNSPEYLKNPYCANNYYWLAIGGYDGVLPLRWGTVDGTPNQTADQIVTVTRQMVRLEQDVTLDEDGTVWNYYDWYWSNSPSISASVDLPNLSVGDSIDIGMEAIGRYNRTDITLNGTLMNRYYNYGNRYYDISGAGVAGLNTLQIAMIPGDNGTYLDYLDISYPMRLNYGGSQMEFSSFDYSGLLEYQIAGYTSTLKIIDISDSDVPAVVAGADLNNGTARFQRQVEDGSVARYVVFADGDAREPQTVEKVILIGLRSDLGQYDCLIIAPRSFHAALQEYVSYRETSGGYRSKLVAVEDIYREFGFGLDSPIAIRSFLEFAYENYEAPAPYAVLLVGDGHYDYMDNTGRHSANYLPPYIWSRQYAVGDDNFVYFGRVEWLDSDSSYVMVPDRGWDMMIARWPVRSDREISDYLAKLEDYESGSSQGIWRSRITFVADDEFKGPFSNEIIHTAMAETLAVFHTPMEFTQKKIYLTEYPFAANGEKPTVNDAIIKAINEGTLIINYIGHGSPEVWADEHVLKKSSDLGRMTNNDKPTVVVAASCSIGFFDAPDKEGMAEMMFRRAGGAISAVSAMRLVYAGDNSIFNYDLYDALFSGQYNLCEAVFTTKMIHQYSQDNSLIRNDLAYVFFGDPFGRLGLPEYRLEIDTVGNSLLIPLESFSFTGQVIDQSGLPIAVDGMVEIAVYDSPIIRQHDLGIEYALPGLTIFRGRVPVTSGQFSGQFIVPLDVDYGGEAARISGYGTIGTMAAMGGLDSLTISDQVSVTTDNSGPQIMYSFEGINNFRSGDRITANATLIIELSDPSGINITGGLGHRIEMVIDDDNNQTINLTERFEYIAGSYQTGTIEYVLQDMSPEMHSFKLTAWDNANNPATVEFEALPTRVGRIAIYNLMNYPNPMEETTEFFFELSEAAESLELEIFTLSGKKIKRFRVEDPPVGRNRLFYWDGRDADGDRIAQGVYIYKMTARGNVGLTGSSADNIAEAFGKLVLLN
jgi:hypothetical protein